MKPLIILAGPTAVGKTDLSIQLAKQINGAIISADSMQVYKYMDIGSAKIMPQEMQGIDHYLIDELLPSDEFNIVRFQQMAEDALQKIYAKGQIPIVAGGTGFYIQALLYDVSFTDQESDSAFRKEMTDYADIYGNHALHEKLREIDPVSYETIHENNRKRVIRALEYFHLTNYFKFIGGASLDEKRVNKDDVIRYVLEENGIGEEEKKSVIMVGDRKHDVEGAKKTGLSVVGVLYGYGSREELQDAGADYLCETPREVAELLRSLAFADGNSLN